MLDSSLGGGYIIALRTERRLCMNTCIEVKDLTKSFNGRTVVDKISFRVEKGEVFGLLGHKGGGNNAKHHRGAILWQCVTV